VVTLDEPNQLNVLSAPLVRQLRRALDGVVADTDIRSVVLTRADPDFSAGDDLNMMRTATEQLSQPEGAVDASWNDSVILEEFAEPTCFTTAAIAGTVHTLLTGRPAPA
jgi:enoyl-CoA hydratase/carnithine racemase